MGKFPIADLELSKVKICKKCKARNSAKSTMCRKCGYKYLRPKNKEPKAKK
ncbi:MAG: 50S ribosomal protein L40e [Candidatus Micrarchaeaceae archaeon]